jgi:hypothetical protein
MYEAHDLFEFWRISGERLEASALGPSCIKFTVGKIRSSLKEPQHGFISSRMEDFYC